MFLLPGYKKPTYYGKPKPKWEPIVKIHPDIDPKNFKGYPINVGRSNPSINCIDSSSSDDSCDSFGFEDVSFTYAKSGNHNSKSSNCQSNNISNSKKAESPKQMKTIKSFKKRKMKERDADIERRIKPQIGRNKKVQEKGFSFEKSQSSADMRHNKNAVYSRNFNNHLNQGNASNFAYNAQSFNLQRNDPNHSNNFKNTHSSQTVYQQSSPVEIQECSKDLINIYKQYLLNKNFNMFPRISLSQISRHFKPGELNIRLLQNDELCSVPLVQNRQMCNIPLIQNRQMRNIPRVPNNINNSIGSQNRSIPLIPAMMHVPQMPMNNANNCFL